MVSLNEANKALTLLPIAAPEAKGIGVIHPRFSPVPCQALLFRCGPHKPCPLRKEKGSHPDGITSKSKE
jgi:hypothetical protein